MFCTSSAMRLCLLHLSIKLLLLHQLASGFQISDELGSVMGAVLNCAVAVQKHSLSCNPVGNLSPLKTNTKATCSAPHA